jgi:stearoyl-CoA desaturase (delta-9 desaturase)
VRWFDADFCGTEHDRELARRQPDRVDLARCVPFIVLHLGCLLVFVVGWSWVALLVALGLYMVRIFAITGFYHRYFSHRAFRTSRLAQFGFAVLGASAVQRGPLWWAYHHRCHHQHSDEAGDAHSPRQHGFWWAHIGWITSVRNFPTDYRRVRDLARYPELVFLNRFDVVVPALLGGALYGAGRWLESAAPGLGVTGWQLLVWGLFVSTTVLFHVTASINSVAHVFGSRRFATQDDSRNNFLLALVAFGEGWHNNHHHYMHCARQGFRWWEVDMTYYVLKGLAWLGIIWDLHPLPAVLRQPAAAAPVENVGASG